MKATKLCLERTTLIRMLNLGKEVQERVLQVVDAVPECEKGSVNVVIKLSIYNLIST
jgi:hypothetical protein